MGGGCDGEGVIGEGVMMDLLEQDDRKETNVTTCGETSSVCMYMERVSGCDSVCVCECV